jgi:hypothetical protein
MDDELTERELLIAKRAARIAVEELGNEFYRQVGRTVVVRVLTWIGMLAVAGITYAIGRGWIVPK